MVGFQFQEKLTGSFTRAGSEHPLQFQLRVRQPSLLQYLRDRSATIEGHIDAGDLASHAVLAGTIVIDPLLGRRVHYDFAFTGDDGKAYRFVGQKDVDPRHPLRTMTTLAAEILDDTGGRYASALVRFDTSDLPRFLGSFRPLR